MTNRATHIKQLADELGELAVNGMYVKIKGFNTEGPEKTEAMKYYYDHLGKIIIHLCHIVENNEEQLEALLAEFCQIKE